MLLPGFLSIRSIFSVILSAFDFAEQYCAKYNKRLKNEGGYYNGSYIMCAYEKYLVVILKDTLYISYLTIL